MNGLIENRIELVYHADGVDRFVGGWLVDGRGLMPSKKTPTVGAEGLTLRR